MSFRWFIYYCALFGGCSAYVGWVLGRLPPVEHHLAVASLRGLFLGMALAAGLTLVDGLWNLWPGRVLQIPLRVLVGAVLGTLGGFVGGFFGQVLYAATQWSVFLVAGWAFTGLLIGASMGVFDLLARLVRNEDPSGALRKVRHGLMGGALGGLLGGLLFLVLSRSWGALLGARTDDFWSPGATGFVALGMCIGLLVGIAQVVLMEAWVRVEEGFRAGRELIVTKAEVTIGRAEGCDIGLFGDQAVEKRHAKIVQEKGRYYLVDEGTQGGTYLNGERISGPAPLRAGDEIEVGRARLRFGERQKREEE